MTQEEYINEHPEKFIDAIDKWLFTKFSIAGGCCSAQGSMEYSVARMVAEKMKQQMIEKAVEWLKAYIHYDDFGGNMEWLVPFENDECMIQYFKTYMEE